MEVIIVGKGPAGVSTALYTARAGIKTTIIGRDFGVLEKADKIENYYGFAEPIDARALIEAGVMQAKRLGCEVISDEVVGIGFSDKLTVKTRNRLYTADTVVLATGSTRNTPKIKGISEFEGKGVSYCAICDAFFYRGKDVCVIGNGEYAKSEVAELLPVVKSVTLLTNGLPLQADMPSEVAVVETPIREFSGERGLEKVILEDDRAISVAGAFIAIGTASSADLAKKIGASISGNYIQVDKNMMTNVQNLYAVGDCVGGLLQISKAVGDGAIAGTSIIKSRSK